MRLDYLLTQVAHVSRNQVKKLIRSKQVTIDGHPATKPNQIIDSHLQDTRVSGRRIQAEAQVYYLLNKPAGVVSACRDSQHETVLDLLEPADSRPGIYPIGRLDRDTEGLILLTNNGPLGFRMLHPKHHVEKSYAVEVNDLLREDAVDFFAQGVRFLDGTRCKPAQLRIVSAAPGHSRAQVTISEGKFHQVKKMFLAYGVKVTYLKRLSFGGFTLDDDLAPGAYRRLTPAEISHLKTYFD